MEKCISDFQSEVKQGPEFVCMCCHRIMYEQTVVLYKLGNYTKAIAVNCWNRSLVVNLIQLSYLR